MLGPDVTGLTAAAGWPLSNAMSSVPRMARAAGKWSRFFKSG
eukprot:CAMPEP_0171068958 /NCGR_PEP_ID=MMETSP0766_2-20121228/8868_1 /TAXON_ID=439317 /ORGANISM="Gambierdiscus australes, Strain CAWD 149" /LENGTH=41 /DNA_ID= /DNA_START= /DNA_END= /DNA_ORIENTATION=